MYCLQQLPQLPHDVLKEQLLNGLILLVVGMVIVFIFLTILVIVAKAVSGVIRRREKGKDSGGANDVAASKAPVAKSEVKVAQPKKVESQSAPLHDNAPSAGGPVKAPMPGLILKINVKVGEAVEKNQLIMVMEAMKMENEIYAPYSGVVSSISVSLGDQVNADDILMEIGSSSVSHSSAAKVESVSAKVENVEVAKEAEPATPAKQFEIPTRRTPSAPSKAPKQALKQAPARGKAPVAHGSSSSDDSVGLPVVVNAPMPGLVLRFNVQEGDHVEKNQQILVLEAMKMENEVYAPASGTLTKFFVSAGQQLESGDKMFEIG